MPYLNSKQFIPDIRCPPCYNITLIKRIIRISVRVRVIGLQCQSYSVRVIVLGLFCQGYSVRIIVLGLQCQGYSVRISIRVYKGQYYCYRTRVIFRCLRMTDQRKAADVDRVRRTHGSTALSQSNCTFSKCYFIKKSYIVLRSFPSLFLFCWHTITSAHHHQHTPSPVYTITSTHHHQRTPSPTHTITSAHHHQHTPFLNSTFYR